MAVWLLGHGISATAGVLTPWVRACVPCGPRVVLDSFRARHVREEGVAVFAYWREWAHWRALERRAIVAHWHKLMFLVRALLG
jgi:hypothetical protein